MFEQALNIIWIPQLRLRPARIVFSSFVAGLLVGVVARGWMRWISTDPEFSWTGTLGIIIGFAAFGTIQSIVLIVRERLKTKRSRVLLLLSGLAVWALIIKSEIVDHFGWDFVTIGRILLFGAIYSSITCALKPTVSARV